jgi:hypothetical protein
MILTKRLSLVPAAVLALAGLTIAPADATADPLAGDALDALVVSSCQSDPTTPLTLEELNPVVLAEADVDVVPGEITAHLVRAEVNTVLGDVEECTFGVLHRDAQLKQVKHVGTASLALVDTVGGTSYGVDTEIDLGNMGNSSPVDPTTEVSLGGFLTPLENVTEDPTYVIALDRISIEVVQIAVHRAQKDAAARLLKSREKAAAKLLKKQLKASKSKHADKVAAAAQRAYDKRIAAAEAAYKRATEPKTVSRPVSHPFDVTGSLAVTG